MTLKGKAKTDYQREYMRRRRAEARAAASARPKAAPSPTRSRAESEIAELKAALDRAQKRIASLEAVIRKRNEEENRLFGMSSPSSFKSPSGGDGVDIPDLAEAKQRIASLEKALTFRKAVISKPLYRALSKSVHPDLATDTEDKASRTALAQEFNALFPTLINIEDEEAKAKRKAEEEWRRKRDAAEKVRKAKAHEQYLRRKAAKAAKANKG